MKIRRKQRHKKVHVGLWAVIIGLFIIGAVGYGAYQGVLGVINSWLEDLPSVENSDVFNYARKTRVYANDNATLLAEFYIENREPVTKEQVSLYVLEGTVATEDERFYEHDGVDLQGVARALYVNMQGGELEGASTITMQFVRNTILQEEATEISFQRKVREAQLAYNLEDIYSKDEILMMYLNTINYGDGCWGIEAAAKNYFQKSALDLTIAEAATLVAIPQSPTYLNPKTNPDACYERRNLVLNRMLNYGTITQEEHDAAAAEPLALNPAPAAAPDGIYAYPYFTSYVRQLLIDQYSSSEVFKGGLTVYTTLDPNIQNMAESAAETQYNQMDANLEVSLTAVDPDTGYIKAMVGGKNYYENQVNTAWQGARHAGSSFKTFTLIAAIEQGINPQTKIDCTGPYTLNGWTVNNYGGANYGIRSIESATAVSSNTGYLRLAEQVSVPAANEVARKMGVTSDIPNLPATTLGAVDVNTLEMATAYNTLAANGYHRDSVAITQIVSYDGTVVFQHEDAPEQVLTPEVSYAATKVLQTVFTASDGTAYNAQLPSGQPAAGKTGTSDDWSDYWLCAYTPQLTCAIWIGNRYERISMDQNLNCTNVWRNFMSMALADQPIEQFATANDPAYSNDFNTKQSDIYDIPDAEDAPDVIGMTLEEAAAALSKYDVVYHEEYSDTTPAGAIISQSVSDGAVILVVSKGPDPNPTPTPNPEPATPDPGDSGGPDTARTQEAFFRTGSRAFPLRVYLR